MLTVEEHKALFYGGGLLIPQVPQRVSPFNRNGGAFNICLTPESALADGENAPFRSSGRHSGQDQRCQKAAVEFHIENGCILKAYGRHYFRN